MSQYASLVGFNSTNELVTLKLKGNSKMNTPNKTDPVAMAIAAAQMAAQATIDAHATNTAVATQKPAGGAVAVAGQGTPFSMETIGSGSLNVDGWLKPKEYGLVIGDGSDLIPECLVAIDMTNGRGFVVKKGAKGGNPAQYAYTTDGVTATSGGSWEAALQKLKNLTPPSTGEYRCVDIPMLCLKSIEAKGKVIFEEGKLLGYTTSTTNWKNWEMFYRDVAQKGLLGRTVEVKVTAEARVNKAGNKWGVLHFKLVGAYVEDETE